METITITKEVEINIQDAIHWIKSDIDASYESWMKDQDLYWEVDEATDFKIYKLFITRLIEELSQDTMTVSDIQRFNESVQTYTKEAREKANAKVRT